MKYVCLHIDHSLQGSSGNKRKSRSHLAVKRLISIVHIIGLPLQQQYSSPLHAYTLLFIESNSHDHLAILTSPQPGAPRLDLIPGALHVVQVVDLVPILCEQRSRGLCTLHVPCPELPLCCRAVQEPARRCTLMLPFSNRLLGLCQLQCEGHQLCWRYTPQSCNSTCLQGPCCGLCQLQQLRPPHRQRASGSSPSACTAPPAWACAACTAAARPVPSLFAWKIMLERSAEAQLTSRACLMVDIPDRQLAVTYVLVCQPASLQYLCHPCDRGAAQPKPLSTAAPGPWRVQCLTGQAAAGRRHLLSLRQAAAEGVRQAPAQCLPCEQSQICVLTTCTVCVSSVIALLSILEELNDAGLTAQQAKQRGSPPLPLLDCCTGT